MVQGCSPRKDEDLLSNLPPSMVIKRVRNKQYEYTCGLCGVNRIMRSRGSAEIGAWTHADSLPCDERMLRYPDPTVLEDVVVGSERNENQ